MSAQTSIGANDGRIQSAVTLAETGPFTIDYPFFSLDDNVITITSAAGAITTYTRGVDYTIAATANDDGIYPSGTVTWLGAGIPVAGTLTRYRETGLTRASQLPLTGYLDRTALNADLNRMIVAMQDLERRSLSALRYPEEDGITASVLVPADQRADTIAAFDADGLLYAAEIVDFGVTVASTFSRTLLDDVTADAWLTTLGFSAFDQTLRSSASLSALVTALGTAPVVAEAIERFVGAPTGRLTLETGVPVSSTDQAGKATIYYTPAGVGRARYPVYDGANWTEKTFTELSNDTTQSATNNAGAAAAGPYQIQDCFVWSNAGTNRLTRGPKWTASATATMTIATPGVVTWTGHGLWDGATVRFTTTGALPTGVTANTDYFVTKVTADTFKLSTTLANQVAGTFITTSGSQSGVHTAFNYTSVRGTGAATTELQLLDGVWVNKYDITNGPAATKGTYVGSVYFNGSSQVDLKFGSYAAAFGEAFIGIWNLYNKANVSGTVSNTAASWSTQGGGVYKAFALSATARASMVSGLVENGASAFAQVYITCDAATGIKMTCTFKTITASDPVSSMYVNNGSGASPPPLTMGCTAPPFLGLGYFIPLDGCTNYSSSYVNSSGYGSYLSYSWRY